MSVLNPILTARLRYAVVQSICKKMKILKSFAVLLLAVASAQPLMACDICGCFDANGQCGMGMGPSSKYITEVEKGFIGGVAEQFTHFGTLQDDGHRIADHGEFINSSISQIFALYNFNKRFGLQLNVPLIYREWGSDIMPHARTSGIGDVSLVGNLRLYKKLTQHTTITWSFM